MGMKAARKKLVCMLALGPVQVVLAQVPPGGAGQIENQLRQQHPLPSAVPKGNAVIESAPPAGGAEAASAPSAVQVIVQHVHFEGNTVFSGVSLESVLGDYRNKSYSLKGLDGLATRIQQFYRAHGYMLARAYVPAQTAANGDLLITVLEGRYDQVRVDNHSSVSTARIQKTIEANACDSHTECHGEVVREEPLRRALLLVGDLPGVGPQVQSTLAPGVNVGTTMLTVTPQPAKRVTAFASIDNFSAPEAGRPEYLAGVNINDVIVDGGQVSAATLTTGKHLISPVLAFSMPVGYLGTRVGVQYSYVHYSVMTSGLESSGVAQTYSAFVSHPIVRALDHNLTVRFTLSHKLFNDTLLDGLGSDHKNSNSGMLALSGDDARLPGGGNVNYSAAWTTGNIHGDLLTASQLGVAGTYSKFNGSVAFLQPLPGKFSAALTMQAQLASRNLDSSEMLLLGGPTAVRSAGSSSGFVTDGFLMNAELRYALPTLYGQRTTLYTFYDLGTGRTDKQPVPDSGPNSVSLAGYGLGISIGDAKHYIARLTYARPTHDSTIGDAHPRIWFQVSTLF